MTESNLSNVRMKTIVHDALSSQYNQLVINSGKVCSYRTDAWAGDLLASVIEYFLKYPILKQYTIVTTPSKTAPSLEKYITRAMALAIKSKTSPFYMKYRRPMERSRELFVNYDYSAIIGHSEINDEDDPWADKLDNIREIVGNMHFYNRYLIQNHYFEEKTLAEISATTQISTYRLSRDIRTAITLLKELLK